MSKLLAALVLGMLMLTAAPPARAQQAPAAPAAPPQTTAATICGQPVPPPVNLPPANSPPVIYLIAPCWEAQGNSTLVEPATYLYYINLAQKRSRPSENVWVPWDDEAEKIALEDFRRLWATN